MKCSIVEDDFAARKLLQVYLSGCADCFIAVDEIHVRKFCRFSLKFKRAAKVRLVML